MNYEKAGKQLFNLMAHFEQTHNALAVPMGSFFLGMILFILFGWTFSVFLDRKSKQAERNI